MFHSKERAEQQAEELVPVRVERARKAAEAPLPGSPGGPPRHEKSPIPKYADIQIEFCKDFLARVMPWGESGKEFILRVRNLEAKADPDIACLRFDDILEACEDYAEREKTAVLITDVRSALQQACGAGLLISISSYGYYPRPEVPTTIYVLNKVDKVAEFLGASAFAGIAKDFKEKEALDLINQAPMFRDPSTGLRLNLTGREFFEFFKERRTLTDAFQNSAFYPPGESYRAGKITSLFEANIREAIQAGLLVETDPPPESSSKIAYILSEQGSELINRN